MLISDVNGLEVEVLESGELIKIRLANGLITLQFDGGEVGYLVNKLRPWYEKHGKGFAATESGRVEL